MSNKKKRSGPLTLPPHQQMPSRKRARQLTTKFHDLTRQLALAGDNDDIVRIQAELEAMGGRQAYQRASQVSTSYYDTSNNWVLHYLKRNNQCGIKSDNDNDDSKVRPTRLLEIGAINTTLLDAGIQQHDNGTSNNNDNNNICKVKDSTAGKQGHRKPLLHVRAIDLHAMHPGIEQADFITMQIDTPYDVIVCSMVINCVPTPALRGEMLQKLYKATASNGLVFLALPRTCLQLSAYINRGIFDDLLTNAIGFEIIEYKESPKIAFYILKKPPVDAENDTQQSKDVLKKWASVKQVFYGKKYRNKFAITTTGANT